MSTDLRKFAVLKEWSKVRGMGIRTEHMGMVAIIFPMSVPLAIVLLDQFVSPTMAAPKNLTVLPLWMGSSCQPQLS